MLDTTAFNWVDWGIVCVLGVSIFLSLWRGFVREALSLVGWVAGFIFASRYSPLLASYLNDVVSGDMVRQVVAFLGVMVATLIATSLLSRLLQSVIQAAGLSFFDRILGSAFGFVRGVVVLLIMAYALKLLAPQTQDAMDQAVLMPHVDTILNWSQAQLQDARVPTI
ncbi:MAG: CvpA family protein [Halieaceae bacterium]|nr:CvpA family protein [Halieaceae bacterium]